ADAQSPSPRRSDHEKVPGMPERDPDRCEPLQPLRAAGYRQGRLVCGATGVPARPEVGGGSWRNPPPSCKIKFRQQPWKDFRVMARVCDICGKGPQFGNTISHAHNVSKRRWNVNLRPVHAKVGAATKHIRVCTSCLRSGKVVKA